MKLLAFELATEACSVALWLDGEVRERFEVAPRRHAELALPWAGELLAEAGIQRSQLDAIAVGRGPGAFTGVRLAVSMAQGVALALDRPVVPVSTLAALAASSWLSHERSAATGGDAPRRVLAAIDARMGDVYSGAFELHRTARGDVAVASLGGEAVGVPASVELPEQSSDWRGVGTGFAALDGALVHHLGDRLVDVDPTALPRAGAVAMLAAAAFARGEAIAPDQLEPAYLRNKVALTSVEQKALRQDR